MKFEERYKYNIKTDLLGKGGFARVYKAKDTLLEREVAVKVFNPSDNEHYTVLEEIKKVINYEHPNLLRYYDVAILENVNVFGEKEQLQVGIMEIANAGDLKTFTQQNPNSSQLSDLLQQVLKGLAYLHSKGIIHRDLKPQNILLQKKNGHLTAKLSDFGISKSMDSNTNSASMTIGTIEYMAPEQFSPNKYGIDGKIATNVDLWSFGIMVYELVMNTPPFGQRGNNTTAEQIMSSILGADLPKEVEFLQEPYKTIVKKCLIADASKRVQKADDLIPYFSDILKTSANSIEPNELDTQIFHATPQIQKEHSVHVSNNQETAFYDSVPDETLVIGNSMASQGGNVPEQPNKSKTQKYVMAGLGVFAIVALFFVGIHFLSDTPAENYAQGNSLLEQKKYSEAFLLLQKASDANNSEAQNKLGLMYKNGLGVGVNYNEALKYFKQSASQDNAAGQFNTGLMYFMGLGIDKNYQEAIAWYQKAVEQNNADAQAFLGDMYASGFGVDKNYQEALKLYKMSAEQNNAYGLNNLGVLYQNGLGVKQDYKEALKFYKKAAEQNNAWGQVDLGFMYLEGLGIAKNEKEAIILFTKAAEQNEPTAQDALGHVYASGLGVKQDYDKAIIFFRKAAEQNFANAQNNLGWMYFNGFGVQKDTEEAVKWFRKAAAQGNISSQNSLKKLKMSW